MRNLVLLSTAQASLCNDALLHCLDPSGDVLYYVNANKEVRALNILTSVDTVVCSLLSSNLVSDASDAFVGIEYVVELGSVVLCMRSGDILQIPVVGKAEPECVGTVDSGALGMSWCPDGELVVFATGNGTLFCLSKLWMPVSEVPLRKAQDVSPAQFRASWEADGGRFVTMTKFADGSSSCSIWSRNITKLSDVVLVKEHTYGDAIAFRPTGFLVAASSVGEVALFESNGLAHGGFPLRQDFSTADQLLWNSDASLLAIVCNKRLQVWRSSNYVWHLAWDLALPDNSRIVEWSKDRLVVASSSHVRLYHFTRDVCASAAHSHAQQDQAVVCVVDGANVRTTMLQRAVVPPPYAHATHALPFVPCSVSAYAGRLAALSCQGDVWIDGKAFRVGDSQDCWMQLQWVDDAQLVAMSSRMLLSFTDKGELLAKGALPSAYQAPFRLYCNVDTKSAILVHGKGSVSKLTFAKDVSCEVVLSLPEFCPFVATCMVQGEEYVFAQSQRFKLYASPLKAGGAAPEVIESNCSSFALHRQFLLVTTLQSRLRFAAFGSLPIRIDEGFDRDVEVGALLVTCIPRGARTVLQAPRGSLETLYPRPLVHFAATQLLNGKMYGRALELMRKHKTDLSMMVTHDAEGFIANAAEFVKDVADSDRLCLFLTQVGEGPVDKQIVNRVCEAVRIAMEAVDSRRFIFPILTSFVEQKPSRVDDALRVVAKLRHDNGESSTEGKIFTVQQPRVGKEESDRALDYLTFLVPVDTLFDHALGMYDFDLVTVVAKKGQKDPKEYVPFLESLRALSPSRMRYTVDVKLHRWESALSNLASEGSPQSLEESLKLIQEKRLYRFALRCVFLDKDSEGRKMTNAAYADYLASKGHHFEASICYRRASLFSQELHCYELIGDWCMGLYRGTVVDPATVARTKETYVALLESQRRWEELSKLLQWRPELNALAGAAAASAGLWSEARLLGCDDLADRLEKAAVEMLSSIRGSSTRFIQHVERLRVLRQSRSLWENVQGGGGPTANPSEYSEMTDLSSVSAMSGADGSSVSSLATLAAGRALRRARDKKKPSSASGGKKKGRGKRVTGKPGSMHEEEWLCQELRGLIPGESMLRKVHELLKALLYSDMDLAASNIQAELKSFIDRVDAALNDLIAPCLVFGNNGLSYQEHWRPAHAASYITISKEHESASNANEGLMLPTHLVPKTFQWHIAILDD